MCLLVFAHSPLIPGFQHAEPCSCCLRMPSACFSLISSCLTYVAGGSRPAIPAQIHPRLAASSCRGEDRENGGTAGRHQQPSAASAAGMAGVGRVCACTAGRPGGAGHCGTAQTAGGKVACRRRSHLLARALSSCKASSLLSAWFHCFASCLRIPALCKCAWLSPPCCCFQVVLRSAWLCWQEWVQLASDVKDRQRARALQATFATWRQAAKAAERRSELQQGSNNTLGWHSASASSVWDKILCPQPVFVPMHRFQSCPSTSSRSKHAQC